MLDVFLSFGLCLLSRFYCSFSHNFRSSSLSGYFSHTYTYTHTHIPHHKIGIGFGLGLGISVARLYSAMLHTFYSISFLTLLSLLILFSSRRSTIVQDKNAYHSLCCYSFTMFSDRFCLAFLACYCGGKENAALIVTNLLSV